jgi:hypothetical protein
MVSAAQTTRWTARLSGNTMTSRAMKAELAAGHSSQPLPVETSAARNTAPMASQIQNGCVP